MNNLFDKSTIKEAADRAREYYGDGLPSSVIFNVKEDCVDQLLSPTGYYTIGTRALFAGSFLHYVGTSRLETLKNKKGYRCLKGELERLALTFLNGNDLFAMAAATVWARNGGGGFLAKSGKVAPTFLREVSRGEVTLEAGRALVKEILGEEVIKWLESLPSTLIFPSHDEPNSKDKSMALGWISEDITVFSPSCDGTTALYEIFGNKVNPTTVINSVNRLNSYATPSPFSYFLDSCHGPVVSGKTWGEYFSSPKSFTLEVE